MVFATTTESFRIHAVFLGAPPSSLQAFLRPSVSDDWQVVPPPLTPAPDVAEWVIQGLTPGTEYAYEILDGQGDLLFEGRVTTQRERGESFTFSLISDTHIEPRELRAGETEIINEAELTLHGIAQEVGRSRPDFVVNLGDMLDFHLFGFNVPPPDGSWTRWGYLNYRRLMGSALGNTTHFAVIGNWDGENGDFTPEQIEWSRAQRLLYLPGPKPETYPQGGNIEEDYYAFEWGDALFVVLNVMTYTTTSHLLDFYAGAPDDWTLGEPQMQFLEQTLAQATSKWRFVLIHHAVGGAAPTVADAGYGRGGGQAAYVGEQARVHQLMQEHGVQIFFYGHDHVFVDMIVDGIHYTLPGSAGALWKFHSDQTGYETYWTESGHAQVHVHPETVNVEFIAQGGALLHAFSIDG